VFGLLDVVFESGVSLTRTPGDKTPPPRHLLYDERKRLPVIVRSMIEWPLEVDPTDGLGALLAAKQ
jgi:hypothetical protein